MRRAYIFLLACCCLGSLFAKDDSPLTLVQKIELARRLADEAASGKAEAGRVIENNFDFAAELKKYRASKLSEKNEQVLADDSDEDFSEEESIAPIDAKTPVATQPIEKESETFAKEPPTKEPKKKELQPKETPVKYAVDTSKDFVNGYYVGDIDEDKKVREQRKREILENIENAKKLAEVKYFSYKGKLFEIVSDDYSAHLSMIYAIGEFEKVIDNFFARENSNFIFDKKISLKISAKDSEKSKKKTSLSISKNGEFSFFVSWSKFLTIEEFCASTSEAILLKIAYNLGGEKSARRVPMWLKMAFASALENSIRFGAVSDLATLAAEKPPPDIFSILSGNGKISSADSYWTLVAIEKVVKGKDVLSNLLRSACIGDSPELLVKRIEVYKPTKMDTNVWWRCVLTGEIWARMGGVLSPVRAEEEIARLAVLSVDDSKGGREGVSGSKIFEKSELYKGDIELRILEIKVALSVVNPLYHNALVCLGEMFESALDGDEDDFNSAKIRFAESFNNARELSKETYNMLK